MLKIGWHSKALFIHEHSRLHRGVAQGSAVFVKNDSPVILLLMRTAGISADIRQQHNGTQYVSRWVYILRHTDHTVTEPFILYQRPDGK